MKEHLISVKDFSEQNGLRRQTVFKVLKRLNIEPSKYRGNNQNRGQVISYITEDEARIVLETLTSNRNIQDEETKEQEYPDISLYDIGVFYLLSLEPELEPNRFKVGFASNLNERLRQHRCVAPYIQVIKVWPCRRLWKKTAIECVTEGCERLHTEVFRTSSIDIVRGKCEQFFELMPKITGYKPT